MSLEDRHVTPTPEGVSLDSVLAGLGSRLAAYALDFLIGAAAFGVILLVVSVTLLRGGDTGELVGAGILALAFLLCFIGYFVACEMLWSGRSVGKRAAGTRVVRTGGTPVGFWSSLLRNVARLVDMIPFPWYLVGSVLVLSTTRNQRLGDLLGDTVVIRVRRAATQLQSGTSFNDPALWSPVPAVVGPSHAGPWPPTPWQAGYGTYAPTLPPVLAHWDVSAVSDRDLVLVHLFLTNRQGYTPEARSRLALQLADRLWPLVAGPMDPPPPEQFLEAVALVKSVRG